MSEKKPARKPRATPGPKPDTLILEGDWQEAVRMLHGTAGIMLSCSTRKHEGIFNGEASPHRLFNLLLYKRRMQDVSGYTLILMIDLDRFTLMRAALGKQTLV